MQAILAHDPERAHSPMRDHVNLLGGQPVGLSRSLQVTARSLGMQIALICISDLRSGDLVWNLS